MNKDEGLYYKDDVPIPETPESGEEPKAWGRTNVVGRSDPRVDAYERVTGTAMYPSDVLLPRMLYGAILRCPYPHARVKKVDVKEAEKLPGVHAVISGKTKGANLKWTYGSAESKIFNPHCRFEGEAVAAVAAETPYQAADALRKIKVEYEELPFVSDERKALEKQSPLVHKEGNLVSEPVIYERGDIKKGFGEADVVLEEEYRTECELHTPLERHGCVASWDGSRLTVWESTQGVYAVQSKLSQVLGLPMSRVRVIGNYMGGGFGSKLQAGKYTIIASLLSSRTACPVKLFLSREETYLVTGNRPPSNMKLKAGVKNDGTLTALEFSCTGTGGVYPAGGTSLVDWLVRDLYKCPNVRTEATDVFINAGPARPFRAPGHPQGAWALEQMMDALAEAIGADPVEIRLKNIPEYSQARMGNPPYTSDGLRECITQGAAAFEWRKSRQEAEEWNGKNEIIRKGAGMGACLWIVGDGGPPSTIVIKLFSDGSVNLNMGASDIGTGTKTVMAMTAAEELGVRPEMIQIEHADTGTTQFATPSGGSKTVPTEAPAVRAAAIAVKRQLLKFAAEDLEEDVENLRFEGDVIVSRNDESNSIKITDISGLKKRGVLIGTGYRCPNPSGVTINPFAAQFCEVAVNMKTGEIEVLRFVGAHESGRVMNRLTFDSQVYGGITMGIGLGMTEERVIDTGQTGKLVTKNWHDYKLPTALDVPADMISVPIEKPDDKANTTGAKGLGEPVTIPTAAAIANAIYHAVGIKITGTPANPVSLNRLLDTQRKEG